MIAAAHGSPAILQWIVAICIVMIGMAPPVPGSEVDIVAEESDDGSFYELNFTAEAGVRYVVESSADMVWWQDDAVFQGIGSEITWNLVELPQADGSTPISDGLPPGYVPPPQVSVQAQRISWDVGTVLRWNSRVDGTPKVHVLDGENLHASMDPVTVLVTSDFHFFIHLGSSLKADDVPYSDPLGGADAAMVAEFVTALPDLYQQVEDGVDTDVNEPPAPLPDPSGKRFFRVRREEVDADDDGTLDHLETPQGSSWFTNDTDGDGIDDATDATPDVNDAWLDPDGLGLPPDLETGLIARWDFEGLAGVAPFGFPSEPVIAGPMIPEGGAGLVPFTGVVSHSVDMLNTGGSALVAPWSLVAGHGVNSFAMWIKLPLNALLVNFFGMDVLGIGRSFGPGEPQSPMFRATITPSAKLRLESNWVNFPDQTFLGEWPLPGGLDDGNWHQLVIVKGPGIYQAYVDGEKLGTRIESVYIPFNLQFRPYFHVGQSVPVTDGIAGLRGQIDRFRLYSIALSDEQVAALYNQDADGDGLYDRVEGATAYWQDLDDDGQHSLRTFRIGPNFEFIWVSEEETFLLNPFHWDPPYSDHDGDGVTSLDEQNIHESDPADPADPGT